jgi:hypothetical protein
MVELGQEVYQDHQWTGERKRFVKLVEELLTR